MKLCKILFKTISVYFKTITLNPQSITEKNIVLLTWTFTHFLTMVQADLKVKIQQSTIFLIPPENSLHNNNI